MLIDELYAYIFASRIFTQWHWFHYHFRQRLRGRDHPLARSFVEACLECDAVIPGYATQVVDRLAAASGREKDERQYEQLLQILAELHVVRHVVTFPWPFPVSFHAEPTTAGSKKNPEASVIGAQFHLGVEVKAPALLSHWRERARNGTQVPARNVFAREQLGSLGQGGQVTLPRDNPIKDFLASADAKFDPFKRSDPQFIGLLVIVWDDYVYEPISSLIHPAAGLFTDNSFAKDENDQPLRFPHVDGVIIIRHLHQIFAATRDEPLIDGIHHPLDYGQAKVFPWKVVIPNPYGATLPNIVPECFQALPVGPLLGAEYSPKDLVWWLPGLDKGTG